MGPDAMTSETFMEIVLLVVTTLAAVALIDRLYQSMARLQRLRTHLNTQVRPQRRRLQGIDRP